MSLVLYDTVRLHTKDTVPSLMEVKTDKKNIQTITNKNYFLSTVIML